jgi:hypothetical protein
MRGSSYRRMAYVVITAGRNEGKISGQLGVQFKLVSKYVIL